MKSKGSNNDCMQLSNRFFDANNDEAETAMLTTMQMEVISKLNWVSPWKSDITVG